LCSFEINDLKKRKKKLEGLEDKVDVLSFKRFEGGFGVD